jgi:hypothetical protein
VKVRLIADGILPADWLTADMETVPRKGDRVLVYDGRGAEHLLAVESVTWPVSPSALRHHADADMPEVALQLIDDMDNGGQNVTTYYDADWNVVDRQVTTPGRTPAHGTHH